MVMYAVRDSYGGRPGFMPSKRYDCLENLYVDYPEYLFDGKDSACYEIVEVHETYKPYARTPQCLVNLAQTMNELEAQGFDIEIFSASINHKGNRYQFEWSDIREEWSITKEETE